MSTENTPNEIASAKAVEIATRLKLNVVHPIVFKDEETGEDIYGYMKEPPRFVKLRVLDKSLSGVFTASAELLDAVLIKEESSPRLYSERSEDDQFVLGATLAAYELIKTSANQFKKK